MSPWYPDYDCPGFIRPEIKVSASFESCSKFKCLGIIKRFLDVQTFVLIGRFENGRYYYNCLYLELLKFGVIQLITSKCYHKVFTVNETRSFCCYF